MDYNKNLFKTEEPIIQKQELLKYYKGLKKSILLSGQTIKNKAEKNLINIDLNNINQKIYSTKEETRGKLEKIYYSLTLNRDELPDYYENLRKLDDLCDKKIPFIKLKKIIHPIILESIILTRLSRNQKLIVINQDKDNTKDDDTVIYAFTHVGRYDVEIITEVIKKPYILVAGDPETMYRTMDGYGMLINGVNYVNADSKSDRKVCSHNMVRAGQQKMSQVIAPEGIWNASKKPENMSKPCLDLYNGTIDTAFETENDIRAIGLEEYGNQFIVYIGEKFSIKKYKYGYEDQKLAKELAKKELRDNLATAKWLVWEYKAQIDGLEKRKDIANDYWIKHVDELVSEWSDKNGKPYYNDEIIESRIYKRQDIFSEEKVFEFMNNIEVNSNNAFLLRPHYNR